MKWTFVNFMVTLAEANQPPMTDPEGTINICNKLLSVIVRQTVRFLLNIYVLSYNCSIQCFFGMG